MSCHVDGNVSNGVASHGIPPLCCAIRIDGSWVCVVIHDGWGVAKSLDAF